MLQLSSFAENPKLLGLSCALVLAIVLSSYVLFTRPTASSQHPPPLHRLDSFMTQVSAANYDKEGHLKALFAALKVQHFSDTQHYEYISPYVTLYTRGNQWIITANSGTANELFDTIQLLDHVTIAEEGLKQLPLLVDTSQLTLHPKQYTAQTEQTVVLHQGKTYLTGTGLTFDWKEKSLQVLDNVHGVFDSSTTPDHYHLTADTLHIQHEGSKAPQKITAQGHRAHFWLPAQDKTLRLDAWANTLHYLPSQNKIILLGHAEIQRGLDHLSGAKIHYNLAHQTLKSNGNTQQSVHIVLHKEKNHEPS